MSGAKGEECIYNFVEETQQEQPKKPLYRSKYEPNLVASTFGLHGTTAVDGKGFHALKQNHVLISSFGRESEAPNPKKFLRKGSREENIHIPSVEKHGHHSNKPPVPSRNDKPVMGLKTSTRTNYITANALEVIRSEPKKRKGDEPRYTEREDYGKVPAYLADVKAEIDKEKSLVEMYVAEKSGGNTQGEDKDNMEILDEGERRELISKLKQRWDVVNASYHKMAHKAVMDTPSEMKRKALHEAELISLEKDLELLRREGPIYIKQ